VSVEDTMKRVQAEAEAQSMRHAAAQLRKFLATALCAHCGEPLGDGEIVQSDDEERTLHKACEANTDQ
jgi:hypothetical protein